MTLRVAVQMDPIETINIVGDSTFALMLEAQRRGFDLHVYTPDELSMLDGEIWARTSPVKVRDELGNHCTLSAPEMARLDTFDVVLLRQDPPFDMAYLATTYLLERVHPKALVVNDPASVRDAPEKILVTDFPDLMPPTLISRDLEAVAEFRARHGDIVMKPLNGNGGAGVFRIGPEDTNYRAFTEHFAERWPEPWITQAFLPAVSAGDKRIILVEGEALSAINRMPVAGDIRSNMARGGSAELSPLTEAEKRIVAAIGPRLRELGLIFAGIDVIGDKITEINVTSPTGLRAITREGGPDLTVPIWDAIEKRRG